MRKKAFKKVSVQTNLGIYAGSADNRISGISFALHHNLQVRKDGTKVGLVDLCLPNCVHIDLRKEWGGIKL